ncbi:unnamed protein product [Paramecium octaurelia]|uniref:Protein kinase domain-containing protein n=1 Tax=Paramecium octaurelia TaxID=43137 RepID=A0A8S1WLI2_PAROT|nr:unnamed protein product [Paramecium octaurelia]
MIERSRDDLYSTGPITPDRSEKINAKCKILGFITGEQYDQQKFVPLRSLLPISIDKLNSIIINLISIILEIVKRDKATPNINLDNIMMLKGDLTMPFIFSYQNKTTARQCEQSLLKQFSLLCKQLGFHKDIIRCDSLQNFQETLLRNIGFEQSEFEKNCRIIKKVLNIEENIDTNYRNKFTELYPINAPKYILNAPNSDQIALKLGYQNREVYELREVEIIEDFENNHLPNLYGYIRYSDILVLFMKKHDWTFENIANKFFRQRQNLQPKQIEQAFLRLFHQMIQAIKYMHSEGIIHRDIKPENIMFDKAYPQQDLFEIINKSVNCVMIDFDRSIVMESYNPKNNTHYEGTPFFRPPEGEQVEYNQTYDIWQLGFMWFVIQKEFYQLRDNLQYELFKSLGKLQANQQTHNHEIKKEVNLLEEQFEKLKVEGKLGEQNMKIVNLKIQKKKDYNSLIEQIGLQTSFVPYDSSLQEIILKMIHIDPQQRATLDDVSKVIENLIKKIEK